MKDDKFEQDHAHKRTRYDGKPWPDRDFYDVVRLTESAPPEVRGKLGYIIGWGPESDPPELGIWVYDLQEVWSLEPGMAAPLGYKDDLAANQPGGRPLRVSGKGELL